MNSKNAFFKHTQKNLIYRSLAYFDSYIRQPLYLLQNPNELVKWEYVKHCYITVIQTKSNLHQKRNGDNLTEVVLGAHTFHVHENRQTVHDFRWWDWHTCGEKASQIFLILPLVWQLLVMVLPCIGFSVVFFLSLYLFYWIYARLSLSFLVTWFWHVKAVWGIIIIYEIRSSDFSFLFIFIFTFDLSPKCSRCLF